MMEVSEVKSRELSGLEGFTDRTCSPWMLERHSPRSRGKERDQRKAAESSVILQAGGERQRATTS